MHLEVNNHDILIEINLLESLFSLKEMGGGGNSLHYETHHGKTCFLHTVKQRRSSIIEANTKTQISCAQLIFIFVFASSST